MIEILGLIGSVIILISMCFKSCDIKGNLVMRIFNIVGNIILAAYAIQVDALSVCVLNIGVVVIDIYHIIGLVKSIKNS